MPLISRPSKSPGRLAGAFSLVCLAASLLAGCNGTNQHGKYTEEFKSQAQERMSMLKSGTEWQMAHQQFLAGDLDKSLKTVNRSLAINPRVAKSHVLKGRILIEKGRLEEARDSLLEAEKLDAENVEAQYYLGIVHEQFSQSADALARYQKAADLDTANPQYVIAASEMMCQLGQFDQAEQYINARKQNFEYNAALRQSLGHIAMLRNDPKTAAERFNEALLLAPDDDAILEDVAMSQMACGNFSEAEFAASKLLEKADNKDRRDLKLMRAKCLISLNRPVEARSILLEMTSDKDAGRDCQVWIELGNCAAVLKDKPHLRLASMRIVALAPDRFEGYTLRALYNRLEGRPEEALSALDEAIQRCGDDPNPYMLRALVLQDLGRPFDAKATLEQGLAKNPTSQRLQVMLSVIEKQTGSGAVTGAEQHNQP
jgi:Flp pilus assembly protein TadD